MSKVLYVTAISKAKKILTYCFLGLVALAISACTSLTEGTASPSKIKFLNKMASAHLEIATAKAEQEIGLSNRTELDTDSGMLFVFNSDVSTCFWMKDTYVPLTIGFVNKQGKLLQTIDMKAQTKGLLPQICLSTVQRSLTGMQLK
jgi:uncharacterized membrane protein (UPF0127 family)